MEPSLPIHPLVVHTPIALIIVSLLFEIVGRATDSEWWRKGAFAMLVVGMLGAGAALLTGEPDAERAEETQGVPEQAVDRHEDAGKLALWVTVGAVVVRALSAGSGGARVAIGVVALLLHITAAVTVGVAGMRGGELVFRHGAGVRVHGEWLRSEDAAPRAGSDHSEDDRRGHDEP